MEVRVNIELTGNPEEVGLLLAQLGETLMWDEDEEDEEVGASWWTAERAAAFVKDLTPPALQALSFIADNAPSVTFLELQRSMGMRGVRLAGRLSSIGFAVARQGSPFPFVRDYYQRNYHMEEGVAELMRKAIADEQLRRRQAGPKEPRRLARPSRLSESGPAR